MGAAGMSSAYHDSRLAFDPKRQVVWDALWRYYFRRLVPAEGSS